MGIGNVDPKSARDSSLQTLVTAVNAVAANLLTVSTLEVNADVTLTSIDTHLSRISDDLDGILGETGDNGTLLAEIESALAEIDAHVASIAAGVTVNNPQTSVTITSMPTVNVGNFPASQVVSVSNFPQVVSFLRSDGANAGNAVCIANNVTIASIPAITGAVTVNNPQSSVTVTSLPAITGAVTVNNPQSSVTVTSLPAVTVNNAFALDATLTGGTQQTKVTNGTQAVDTVAGDSGQNFLLTGSSCKTITITTGGASDTVVDCANYRWGVIQAVSIGSTISFTLQFSADNVTWLNMPEIALNSVTGAWVTGANTTTGMFGFALPARYFRVHVASQTGAAPNLVLNLFSTTPPFAGNQVNVGATQISSWSVGQSGTWTVQPGNTQNTKPWAVGGLPPATSLSAVTATGAGTAIDLGATVKCQSIQVTVGGTGSLSALTVTLEGSLDGATWVTLATMSTAGGGMAFSVNQPVSRIRANCTVRTAASGTPTITALVAAA